jgi:hypothetical protein
MVRGPKQVEEALADFIVGPSCAARGGYGLWAVAPDDLFESVANFCEGLFPGDWAPLVVTSGAGSLERNIQASRMIVILHRIPSPRAAFGNGVGGLGSGKSLVRFHRDKTVSIDFRSESTRVVTRHANDSF